MGRAIAVFVLVVLLAPLLVFAVFAHALAVTVVAKDGWVIPPDLDLVGADWLW